MYNLIAKKDTQKQGFTLIEVIVSIALFTVVMTVALGALFMVINSNKQAKAIKLVVNNVNLAMEGMTRDLRVGFQYCDTRSQLENGVCDTGSSGSTQIWFTTDEGLQLSSYALDSGTIKRCIATTSSACPSSINDPRYLPLTGSDVTINDLRFYIQGTTAGDSIQPYITLVIRGTIRVGDILDTFQLQSTISQRKLAP